MIYRQGDVLLQRVDKDALPRTAEKQKPDNGRIVLAYGEVTGHAHAIDAKTCTMYAWEGNRLIEVTKPTKLTHEEHSAIALTPGYYKVTQQREYAPEAIRNVAD